MLSEKIKANITEAMKAKDELKVSALRMLSAAIKNYEIEKGGAGYAATDEDVVSVVQKQVKQRKDSIEAFKSAGRDEMAEKESKELEILQGYLPAQMGEAEVKEIVAKKIVEAGATSIADIGKVMGALSLELKGKADMNLVSKLVREKLS